MGIVRGEEMVLNIGPQHPATHGVLRLQVKTDGEVVSQITPYMGYLHRCFEKHCENVTYEQVIPFTDRCDYLSSMSMNFGYVVAMEELMDIKVNDRVEHIRVVMGLLTNKFQDNVFWVSHLFIKFFNSNGHFHSNSSSNNHHIRLSR